MGPMIKPDLCPDCGGKTIPIAYGLPSNKMFKLAEKGKIHLGGCCIPSMDALKNPGRYCPRCEKETRET